MTSKELEIKLQAGATLNEILVFVDGQDCTIFKAKEFCTGDEVLYIPDVELNEIPINIPLNVDNSMSDNSNGKWGSMTAAEQITLILSYCYTGDDFLSECDGNERLAEDLFHYCDWQHPSSALPELEDDEEAGTPVQNDTPKTKEEATMSNNNHNSILRVIETIYALQTDMTSDRTTTSVCPRCGQATMAENPVRNALSRHATVYICDACGTDEAIRDWNKNVLPLESWACAKLAECHVFKTLNPAD